MYLLVWERQRDLFESGGVGAEGEGERELKQTSHGAEHKADGGLDFRTLRSYLSQNQESDAKPGGLSHPDAPHLILKNNSRYSPL